MPTSTLKEMVIHNNRGEPRSATALSLVDVIITTATPGLSRLISDKVSKPLKPGML